MITPEQLKGLSHAERLAMARGELEEVLATEYYAQEHGWGEEEHDDHYGTHMGNLVAILLARYTCPNCGSYYSPQLRLDCLCEFGDFPPSAST